MHATIPIDFSGQVLTPAVQLWCDKRCAGIVAEAAPLREIQEAFTLVGNVPNAAWLGWKIKWLQANQPEIYQKTWKVLTSSAYSRGVFFGLTPRSGKGALARAIMEGIAFEMLRSLEIARQSSMPVDQIRLVGGGAQSPLWNQIKANIYQLPLAVLKTFEGGTLGAAILAGVAGGAFKDEASGADQVVQIDHVLQPDPAQANLYNRLYAVFKDLHDRMIDSFERLKEIFFSPGGIDRTKNHIS
jgi:sugar (pentulose or hexulose) kinase